jgi:hypothetical protein
MFGERLERRDVFQLRLCRLAQLPPRHE